MDRFVDSSNNNAHVSPALSKLHGAKGMYLKVSEGAAFVDSTFRARRAEARTAKLPVGGYHFGHPNGSAVQQADHFMALLGPLHPGDLIPCLDLEVADGEISHVVYTWALAFCERVHAKLGVYPVVYSGSSFMHANGLDRLPGKKWAASYGARPALHWDAWQYTDGKYAGAIDGLDTSMVPHIALLQFKPPVHKRVVAHLTKAQLRARILAHVAAGWSWARIKKTADWRAFRRSGGH